MFEGPEPNEVCREQERCKVVMECCGDCGRWEETEFGLGNCEIAAWVRVRHWSSELCDRAWQKEEGEESDA